MQRLNGRIEIAMLLLQPRQLGREVVVVLICHNRR